MTRQPSGGALGGGLGPDRRGGFGDSRPVSPERLRQLRGHLGSTGQNRHITPGELAHVLGQTQSNGLSNRAIATAGPAGGAVARTPGHQRPVHSRRSPTDPGRGVLPRHVTEREYVAKHGWQPEMDARLVSVPGWRYIRASPGACHAAEAATSFLTKPCGKAYEPFSHPKEHLPNVSTVV